MVARKPSTRIFGLGTRLLLLGLLGIFPVIIAINNYLNNFDEFLIRGQQESLMEKSLTFAAALNGQSGLFDLPTNINNALSNDVGTILNYVWDSRNIVTYNLDKPIILDGNLDDWKATPNALSYIKTYARDNLLSTPETYDPFSLSFQHMVGTFGDFVYALFIVDDDQLIYRSPNSLSLDKSDHLQIGLVDKQNNFKQYKLTFFKQDVLPYSKEPIYSNAFLMGYDNNNAYIAKGPENKIQANIKETLFGYLIELRIHNSILGDKLAFAIADVDKPDGEIRSVIGTAGVQKLEDLGEVLIGSAKISQILQNFDIYQTADFPNHNQLSGLRIWIADKNCTVRAYAGSLKDETSKIEKQNTLLKKIYSFFISQPVYDFEDNPRQVSCAENKVINTVINRDTAAVDRRMSSDNKTVILASYAPVSNSQGEVVGIVSVEQSLNKLISQRNSAIESLFNTIFLTLGCSALALLIFAIWLTSRIRRLSYDATVASSVEGKVIQPNLTGNQWADELGDLSRTISNQWRQISDYTKKLESYNQYLSQYKDKLRHEMQTPTSVIKSSLELLSMENNNPTLDTYIQRALKGSDSLDHLLQSLSQAKNIEGAVKNEKKQWFNLTEEITNYVKSFAEIYPKQKFIFNISNKDLYIFGAAWLIRQMLDKIIDNAVEFSSENRAIEFSLYKKDNLAIIKVENFGFNLPKQMNKHIFDFMVSVRSSDNKKAHLGLGLYMAKIITQFHQGSISASNNINNNGVIIEFQVPAKHKD